MPGAEYTALLQAGDYENAANAQVIIGRAAARLDRLEDNKTALDQKRSAPKTEPQARPAPAASPTTDQQIDAMQLPQVDALDPEPAQ